MDELDRNDEITVSKDSLRPEKPDVDSTPRKIKELNWLVYALVLVLFIGFAGIFVAVGQMMIDSLNDRRDSTYHLQQKIDEQSEKIDSLTDELRSKGHITPVDR